MPPRDSFLNSFKKHWVEILVFSLALIAIAVSVILVSIRPKEQARFANVSYKGEIVYRLDLSQEQDVEVQVTDGKLQIRVKNGKIAVVSSPCPSQYCVHQGEKNKAGDSIVCAHEGVTVYLVSEGETEEITI